MQTNNIFNNNRQYFNLKINYDEYWDFYLNKDIFQPYSFDDSTLYDKCLISYIDLENSSCIENDWIVSMDNYQWEYAISNGETFYNIGYTGVDNGLIQFRKDRISNKDFLKIYSESDFTINSGDTRLKLHAISGNTMVYEYPYEILNGSVKLNGGFFQGVFKTECENYQILPSTLNNGDEWHFEFVLNKTEFDKESNKTLNDKHPNNKGFFFFIGTRAENKWAYFYDKTFMSGVTDITLDDVIDDEGMECNPDSLNRFSNLDWYDELNWWRIDEEIKKHTIDTDDYVNYIYYPQDLYDIEYENEYLDEYVFLNSKPIVIDDEKLATDLSDCCLDKYSCGKKKEKQIIVEKTIHCCNCGHCKEYSSITEVIDDSYICCSEKYTFDDYLLDADEVFEWYGDTEYLEDELNIEDFDFQTAKYGLSIKSNKRYNKIYSDNKFLLFHRAKDGFTIGNWVEDTIVEYRQLKSSFNGNLFLLMNRTCTGYTIQTIDDLLEQHIKKYNIYEDLYNNALGFRITDDGKIGYRYIDVDCEINDDNKIQIHEGYSKSNIIHENEWYVIHIVVVSYYTTMKFKFYVNGKLKYITKEVPKLKLRKLNEEDEKQELVAYNISLGGGTQGLCDVILPNYMKVYDYVFPLEEYFSGTFIGYIKKFRFYNCKMEYLNIYNNFTFEKNHLLKI